MSGLQTRLSLHCLVSLSLTLALTQLTYALSPVNSIQEGRIIQGGTYYNTPNSQTTFKNSHSGDLWLQSGTTVRGLEVHNNGNLTNNGGTIQLYAPQHVVRVDGTIDVNSLINGQGAYLGNGGKVIINSAYLYQDGNITALGTQGGHVNINVNSATFGPLSKIDAGGSPTGIGGTIRINASGVVDIKNGAGINTSGVPFPGVDSNVIEIIGRVVNNEGQISANGISTNFNQNPNASNGGTVHLVANNGNPNLQPVAKALAESTLFNATEKQAAFNRLEGLTATYANSIRNLGSITAQGGTPGDSATNRGGNGGTINLTAARRLLNQSTGLISADGGQGGTGGNGGQMVISNQLPTQLSQNDGLIQANGGKGQPPVGIGGQGGHIILKNLINTGSIAANGASGVNLANSRGGIGGIINASNITNTSSGNISALGGSGSGRDGVQSGNGGSITVTNLTNSGTVAVDGGSAGSPGGALGADGGFFQGTNVFNSGNITANGGDAVTRGSRAGNGGNIQATNITNTGLIQANGENGYYGGNGGVLNFDRIRNAGIITANGGNTFNYLGISGPAGNGGTIIGTRVINTGTVEAFGGIGDGGPNGEDGTIIGF